MVVFLHFKTFFYKFIIKDIIKKFITTYMKYTERQFVPLLFAGDINSYSMARAFYEAYGVRSIVYGKLYTGPNCNSRISDYRAVENIEDEDVFLETVNKIADEYKEKKVIVIPCGDSYVELVCRLKDRFKSNVITSVIDFVEFEKLTNKESFYTLCKKYNLAYPKTFIYSKDIGDDIQLDFPYPVIVKPSNGVEYWKHPFDTQKKVYRVKNKKELMNIINNIYGAGYNDKLIIQDMIPGDDTYMYVLTGYSDRNGKVKLLSLGHVLREEHTPHGLGNHSVIINDVNINLCEQAKKFLEDIKYRGYFNFDIKYDSRDGVYKFFEINARQGRSNYYVTGSGYNLAEYIVKEYVEGKEVEYTIAQNKILWIVIPAILALIYINPKKYKKEMISLILKGKMINPVFNIHDMGFVRFLRFFKTHISHFRKMRLE